MHDYGSDPEMDMMMDYDYHMNTGELGEYFPDEEDCEEQPEADYEDGEVVEMSLDETIAYLKDQLRELKKLHKQQNR